MYDFKRKSGVSPEHLRMLLEYVMHLLCYHANRQLYCEGKGKVNNSYLKLKILIHIGEIHVAVMSRMKILMNSIHAWHYKLQMEA